MDSIEILERLVSCNTVSDRPNMELIEFVETYLAALGVDSFRVGDQGSGKANLVATVGPDSVTGGIILSGHSDVVPVEGQPWSSDPFTLTRRDDRYFGRGTCDMKGFIAIVLAMVPELLSMDLKRPLHIAITYDEETDLSGAFALMPELRRRGFDPEAVIIGEPTEMQMITAHKGHYHLETTVTGQDAHASMTHLGLNAIVLAADMIGELERMGRKLSENGNRLEGLDPEYTTINVGTIQGGAQYNMVPRNTSFEWEMRLVPGDDGDGLVDEFSRYASVLIDPHRDRVADASVVIKPILKAAPMVPRDNCRARRLVSELTGDERVSAVPFGTEAPCYQSLGMPVVVYGPGSIAQAHKPDEYIALDQVRQCEDFVRHLGLYLAR